MEQLRFKFHLNAIPNHKKEKKKIETTTTKKMPKYLIIDTMMTAQSFLKNISNKTPNNKTSKLAETK